LAKYSVVPSAVIQGMQLSKWEKSMASPSPAEQYE
jgi:hypothetical protein